MIDLGIDTPERIRQIAAICHEANRAYCESIGDRSQPTWDRAPTWQVESAMLGVQFHLENPDADACASHDSWAGQKRADGWIHGETKDPEKKLHPCLIPFFDLSLEQQMKDYIFRGIVHSMRDGFLGE